MFRLIGACGALAVLLGLAACSYSYDEAALARAVEKSQPRWENYQEDVKEQIGAGPIAEWQGDLERIQVRPGQVDAVFTLKGPWAGRKVAVPVLLRDPLSGVYRNSGAVIEGPTVTYTFQVPMAENPESFAWLELSYPHRQRRIVLSSAGAWGAETQP